MDKASIIAIRNTLSDNGKNRTLRVLFDNGINVSEASDIIIWDDKNERIFAFTADSKSGSFAAGLPIQIICSTYDSIQFITSNTAVKIKDEYKENYKLEDLSQQIDNLKSLANISANEKASIIEWFSKLFDGEHELSRNTYLPTDIRRGNKLFNKKG